MKRIFLDSSYTIALLVASDQYHERALELSDWIVQNGIGLVTTRAVILEIGNALAKQRYRNIAIELLQTIEEDPKIEIVPMSEPLYEKSLALYVERLDKDWGITDCISFVVMQDFGIVEVLTADVHFRQAGFQPLLV